MREIENQSLERAIRNMEKYGHKSKVVPLDGYRKAYGLPPCPVEELQEEKVRDHAEAIRKQWEGK